MDAHEHLVAHVIAMPVATTCLQFHAPAPPNALKSFGSAALPTRPLSCGRYKLSAPTAKNVSEPEISKKRSVPARTLGNPAANWMASAAPTEGTMVRRSGDLKFVICRRWLRIDIVVVPSSWVGGIGGVVVEEMSLESGEF